MGGDDLPVIVIEQERLAAVQNAHAAGAQGRAVLLGVKPPAPGFDADEFDVFIIHEGMEQADGIAAAPHAGHTGVGKPAFGLENLRARLAPDDGLEIAYHLRERMRPHHRTDDVVGRPHRSRPVAQRLVRGVLQCLAARGDRNHPRAQKAHAEHVERLPADVFLTHVDVAFKTEQSRRRGGGHPVLAGSRLRDDSAFSPVSGPEEPGRACCLSCERPCGRGPRASDRP